MLKLKGKTVRPLVEEKTLVFVYGTLKSGHGNNHILQDGDARLVGEARTLPVFRLYARYIPYLVPATVTHGLRVKGEVWEVDARTLERMDRLEGHPHMYTRTTVEVETDEGFRQAEAYLWTHPINGSGFRDIGEEYLR